MKKVFITLLVGFVGLISFSNSQFIGPVKCEKFGCTNLGNCNYCEVPSSSTRVWCEEGTMAIITKNRNGELSFGGGKTCPFSANPQNYVNGNYTIVGVAGVFDPGKIYYMGPTSKMPVSEFAPVINGLESVVNEFIPYVVYIGIGLISAVIGFVAVRRLINWVRGKSLGVFRSKKK